MGDNLYIYYQENDDQSTDPITILGWDSTEDHDLHIMVDGEVVEYDYEVHGSEEHYIPNEMKVYVRLRDGEYDYPNIFRRLRSGEWKFLAHQLWNDFLKEGSLVWVGRWPQNKLSKSNE